MTHLYYMPAYMLTYGVAERGGCFQWRLFACPFVRLFVRTITFKRLNVGPQQMSTGFASWLRYCIDVAQRRSAKLCTMFGRLLDWCIYTFSGAVAP